MSKGFHIPKLFNYRIAFYQGCFPLLSLQMTIVLCGIQLRSSALEYIKIKSNFYCVSTVSQTLFFIYPLVRASACMLSCFSHVQSTLCGPMDYGLPGSSVHGILQARILKWVAVPSSRGLPDPGIEPESLNVSCIPLAPPGKPVHAFRKHELGACHSLDPLQNTKGQ